MRAARGVEVFRWVGWWGVTRAVAMVGRTGDVRDADSGCDLYVLASGGDDGPQERRPMCFISGNALPC